MVLVKPREGRRVGEQDAGVEDVRVTLHRVGHAKLPWAPVVSSGAADRTRRPRIFRGQNVSDGPGLPAIEGRAGPLVARSGSGGLPRGHPGEVPAISEGTHDQGILKAPICTRFTEAAVTLRAEPATALRI